MFVAHFEGLANVNSEEELMNLLEQRPAFNANNFVLSFNENADPQLNILVKNNDCVIHYLDSSSKYTYVSYDATYSRISNEENNEDPQFITFYITDRPEEQLIPIDYLVSINSMKKAAIEFFHTHAKPTCINWEEL